MSASPEFEAKLRALIVEAAPAKYKKVAIDPETRLKQDLGIDSIGLISVLFRFEKTFGVSLNPDDVAATLEDLRTFGDAVRMGQEIIEAAAVEARP